MVGSGFKIGATVSQGITNGKDLRSGTHGRRAISCKRRKSAVRGIKLHQRCPTVSCAKVPQSGRKFPLETELSSAILQRDKVPTHGQCCDKDRSIQRFRFIG